LLLFAASFGYAPAGCLAIPAGSDQFGHHTGSTRASHGIIMAERDSSVVGHAPHLRARIRRMDGVNAPLAVAAGRQGVDHFDQDQPERLSPTDTGFEILVTVLDYVAPGSPSRLKAADGSTSALQSAD
jgi:hypothetical protein